MNLLNILKAIKHTPNRLQNKIVYIHVPKCGGNSINTAIKNSYGFWINLRRKGFAGVNHKATKRVSELLDEPLYEVRRKILMYLLSQPNNRFIKGHVGVNTGIIKEFCNNWNFITVLRNPVERWYSEYFYNRFKDSDHFKIDLELEEYVSSQMGIQNGHKYLTYFSGKEEVSKTNIHEAKNNLAKFSVVGLLEDISIFKKEFEQSFSTKLAIPHKNKNPAPRFIREDISPAIHEKVTEICEPDIEVYNWVKETL